MNVTVMTRLGYKFGAPTKAAELADVAAIKKMRCTQCGGSMNYEGWHNENSYIAQAVCSKCGKEVSI